MPPLSAAAYHGAAHQKPQVFQVMVPKARRGLECGGVRVDFVARRDMSDTPVLERNTPTGVIRIASPAATALELVGYPERCGYLDNVATVIAELAESIEGDALEAEARRAPVAWVQRLGYLLALGCLANAERLSKRTWSDERLPLIGFGFFPKARHIKTTINLARTVATSYF